MSHYIRSYPNFFDDDLCDAYVQTFEETMEKDKDEVFSTSICYGDKKGLEGQPICGTCNCQRMNTMGFDRFEHLNTLALSSLKKCLGVYKKDVDLHPSAWPENFGWEELRMKRFMCDTDEQFQDHVDVKSREGAKRFLIMMVYLNDNFDEGETEFPVLGDKIRPEKGKLLMFPPMWQYLHRGNRPKNGHAKYFLMTYLNFVD